MTLYTPDRLMALPNDTAQQDYLQQFDNQREKYMSGRSMSVIGAVVASGVGLGVTGAGALSTGIKNKKWLISLAIFALLFLAALVWAVVYRKHSGELADRSAILHQQYL